MSKWPNKHWKNKIFNLTYVILQNAKYFIDLHFSLQQGVKVKYIFQFNSLLTQDRKCLLIFNQQLDIKRKCIVWMYCLKGHKSFLSQFSELFLYCLLHL